MRDHVKSRHAEQQRHELLLTLLGVPVRLCARAYVHRRTERVGTHGEIGQRLYHRRLCVRARTQCDHLSERDLVTPRSARHSRR
jgi:hypothetical protein